MFPQDRYTPHGYLDNPAHGWKMGPGGVLRSRPGVGLGWHFPSFPHGYNYNWFYAAHLQLGFNLPGTGWLWETADFARNRLDLYSDYHSKNWLSFVFETPPGLRARAIFFLAEPFTDAGDALGCLVQLRNQGPQRQTGSLVAALDYERNLGQGLDWTSGLYARPNAGGVSVAGFQEGAAFHLRSTGKTSRTWTEAASFAELAGLLEAYQANRADPNRFGGLDRAYKEGENVTRKIAAQQFDFELGPGQETTLLVALTRDVSEFRAVRRANRLLEDEGNHLYEAMAERRRADSAFWDSAPRLSGDWPEHIRRGLVYDLETLRMLVREPYGIYKHKWDAMQIQVPRTVLAEAALDMLILSYADPEAAKAVLLGTFADAPEPNVPCSREDGSYNMVAVDGSPCGTAPEWCFPFHCIELVYRRTLDKEWLGELYPYLEAFIGFWQKERTDPQGRPFYKCSWEAGQDNSARFAITNDPSGGGALGEHLWPVDLQAAMTQCCWLLASWADELGLGAERVSRWNGLAGNHFELMQQLWRPAQNWFHDFDRRTNSFTSVLDTMQLAPLLGRAVTPEQVAALQPKLENPPLHGQIFHPLMWPSIVFCLVEACSESNRADLAARHGWQGLDAFYRWLDSRPASVAPDQGGLPGVGREYWPQVGTPQAQPPRGGGGAEVYGWGCLGAYLLLRYVVGLQEERPAGPALAAFMLRPNLPAALMLPGRVYRVENVPCQQLMLDFVLTVQPDSTIAFQLTARDDRATGQDYLETFLLENGQAQLVRLNRAQGLKRG
jgi:hypothetical protein